jgi:hypothetical protein
MASRVWTRRGLSASLVNIDVRLSRLPAEIIELTVTFLTGTDCPLRELSQFMAWTSVQDKESKVLTFSLPRLFPVSNLRVLSCHNIVTPEDRVTVFHKVILTPSPRFLAKLLWAFPRFERCKLFGLAQRGVTEGDYERDLTLVTEIGSDITYAHGDRTVTPQTVCHMGVHTVIFELSDAGDLFVNMCAGLMIVSPNPL